MQTPQQALKPVPQYPIESVDKALRLLLMFRERSELRLLDAREALGVGQSTAHRLMAMLAYHGFVTQDPVTRMYRVGPALVDVGLAAVQRMDVRGTARPFLEALAAEVGETVHLAVLEGPDVRFIDAVESDKALRVAGRVGMLLPAHATSVGKALLAELSPARLRELYPDDELPAVTSRTLQTVLALEDELEKVRRRGHAVNAEESEDGVSSVGAVVHDRSRGPVAAVSVAAPVSRTTAATLRRVAQSLVETAGRISDALAS